MHSVEALLAAADVTGRAELRIQAVGIARRVALEFAEPNRWRIPEHYDPHWQPMLEHNVDAPNDPFQPYGATVGHGLEWSRLLLDLEAALGGQAPEWLRPSAVALFDRAVADGWAVDGAQGSSTPPTGTAAPSCGTGCTGCWPKPSRPRRRCTA